MARRGYGDLAIRYDLEQAGTPADAIESALDALEPERERLAALIGTAPTLRDLRRFASKGFDGATLEDLASALGFDEAA